MRHTGGPVSCPGRCGAMCGYSSTGCGRVDHQGAQPNHHHHHSHFDRYLRTLGERTRLVTLSPPGPSVGQGGACPGAAVASWAQCNTTTGDLPQQQPDQPSQRQGDGGDVRYGQGQNRAGEAARLGSHRHPLLPRHLGAGQPHESRGVEVELEISSAMHARAGGLE